MTRINRRDALASLGWAGGAALLAGCRDRPSVASAQPTARADATRRVPGRESEDATPHDEAEGNLVVGRTYAHLDPAQAAETAYRIYPQGGCMYALVGSVVEALADKVGEPYRSFPRDMMRYGSGGIGHFGSVCGVVNGGAAVVGLIHPEPDNLQREKLIRELCVWYENAALPASQAPNGENDLSVAPSVAGSVLCHISVSRWCQASGCEAFSPEKKERCRRLTADGTRKVVELLNRADEGEVWPAPLTREVHACVDCHGKQAQADAVGTMDCNACHTFDGEHP